MIKERYVWGLVAAVLVMGIAGWSVVNPVAPEAPAPKTEPQARPIPAAVAQPVPRQHIGQLPDDVPLAAQVERLIATHRPEQAYQAYWLLADCESFNHDHDRMIFDATDFEQNRSVIPFRGMTDSEKKHDEKLCNGMTERMRLARFDYLAAAAKAGIIGAAVQVAKEGPFGDRTALTTRPDDPLVREWKTTAREQLQQQAESGDLLALNYLWMTALTGDALIDKDPALAYRYALAQGLIYSETTGPTSVEASVFAPDGPMTKVAGDLSDDQRTTAQAAARHIAAIARERRHH
ncbi:hypothetical protein FHW58_004615 [Duganella sp. 1224]|uniref:hypothetical protein n=1 Tax=Duganella sp. 1224 TaxID=2587052 RepID=UPI0015CD041B|nr:hypothetical protein [Duganella sp. 1224]NYE63385.1 hypothetical protein [Duganella sp. 1224]